MRAIELPGVEKAILSDTVGFISDLPTQLVAAFRAPLEEVTGADVIVHVRDMANPDAAAQKQQVLQILTDLEVIDSESGVSEIPILEAWNKFDALPDERRAELTEIASHDDKSIPISAMTGEGVEDLLQRVDALLTLDSRTYEIELTAGDGMRSAWLHQHGQVIEEKSAEFDDGPVRLLSVRLTPKEFGRFSSL